MKSINLREIDRSGQDVARILYQRAYATRAVYDVPNRNAWGGSFSGQRSPQIVA